MIKEKLIKKDFQEILDNYNIGIFKSAKYIDIAIENANYKITTTKGKFVLKIFESRNIGALKFQNRLINYLNSKRVKVAPIIFTKKGKDIIKYKKRFITIFKFIEGKHIDKLSVKLVTNLAKEISRFHKVLLEYKPPKNHQKMFYSESEIGKFDNLKLKKSMVHGDLGLQNLLFNNNKVSAILDFNDAHYDYLITDLAVVISSFFIEKQNFKYLKIFIKEYKEIFNLNREEEKLILYFTKIRIKNVQKWITEIIRSKNYKPFQLKYLQKSLKEFKTKLKFLDNLEKTRAEFL